MTVSFRRMTDEEYEVFYRWSVRNQAEELAEELKMSIDRAMAEAEKEIGEMLPQGKDSENSQLMTVQADEENVGFIWFLYEETEGRRQCFLCELAIWEKYRRKGYGQSALQFMEEKAGEDGIRECVLFVRNDNQEAVKLYEKCGYHVLREHGYGRYMNKTL